MSSLLTREINEHGETFEAALSFLRKAGRVYACVPYGHDDEWSYCQITKKHAREFLKWRSERENAEFFHSWFTKYASDDRPRLYLGSIHQWAAEAKGVAT
jgi:hypothetical protein